ncbi:MAG: hypothetical protein WDO16_05535 [Bacteroidota bacterium]
MLQGTDFLSNNPEVEINLGQSFIRTTPEKEAGTGYIKQTIEGRLVKPEMGKISITSPLPPLQKERGTAPLPGDLSTGSILKTLIK